MNYRVKQLEVCHLQIIHIVWTVMSMKMKVVNIFEMVYIYRICEITDVMNEQSEE